MNMRKISIALTLFALALPAIGGAQQTERERQREAERREAEKEREAERREREAERRAEQREREIERREAEREREAARREREREVREREQEQEARLDTTLAFGKGGIVDLTLVSGEIIVRAWARPEVQIRSRVERGSIQSELSNTRVSLTVRSNRGHGGDARYELQVPVGTRVIARGTSADILVSGVQAAVEARSTSGDIDVDSATGRVTIESVSGDVMGRSLSGTISANAVSGDVEVHSATGDISAATVSGDITLTRITSRDVRVETVSGEVDYEGGIDRAGRYDFHSHSGNIAFSIPEGTGASLSLETFSGELESDFPVTIQPSALTAGGGRRGTKRIETTIGGGGARIIAETFSGNITIQKGRR